MNFPLQTSLLFSLSLAGGGLALAGDTAGPIPASTNVRGAKYPQINPDLSVTFRIQAPDAYKVEFDLGKRYPATRTDDGAWSATTDPQVPGFHYYWLVIDGVQVNDPASESFYGVGKQCSGIEIPEKGVDYYMPRDVPHGEVRERWYIAKCVSGGIWRSA